jgi:protein PhnA
METKDSNGAVLADGDSVLVIKTLKVKGTSGALDRGAVVKNIKLTDNPEEVEARINGSVIVLKACFLKKRN